MPPSGISFRPQADDGLRGHEHVLRLDRRARERRASAERLSVPVSDSRLSVRAHPRPDSRRREPSGRHTANGVFQRCAWPAAITGVALGLLLGEPLNAPYGGMFGFCLLSTLAMVYVKRHATLPPDTLIGVFHALTLGLGLCLLVALTRQFNVHQVESMLFGSLLTVTDGDLLLLLAVGLFVAILLVREYNNLLLDSLSPQLSTVAGNEPAYLEYFFALLLTLSIVVSLKIIGALLVEALVVVPAAAARNVAHGTRSYLIWSVAVAFLAGVGGLGISTRFLVPTGGAVVLAVTGIFFVTLAARSLLRRRLS
jgi:zinc transport system permease protein